MAIIREQGKRYGFNAIAEDAEKLSTRMLNNEELCKLLYYNSEDALLKEDLTDDIKEVLIDEDYIVFRPKVEVEKNNNIRNVVTTTFDHFSKSGNQVYYNYIMTIDVLCHIDNWYVYDRFNQKNIRPLLIADNLVKLVHDRKFSGIGRAEFLGARSLRLASNPDYVGVTLSFQLYNSLEK